MSIIKIIKFFYTCNYLGETRKLYNLKICYKKHINFLKKKTNISKGVSNRLVYSSNYYKSYKILNYYYINFLRANFCKISPDYLKLFLFSIKNTEFYLEVCRQFNAIQDINRMLLWRGLTINSMFRLRITRKKKKKKLYTSTRIQFIPENKRILLVWSWLKLFLKSLIAKKNKKIKNLNYGLENFIVSNPKNHIINNIKLQTYKVQLLRNL